MYDPYDRIQTKATWDTQNLLVNMAEQTEAMKKQKEQLDKLREMGLSAQTIDILGLGKAENAQQLNNIMGDATPESIAALNAAAKERAGAAGALYTDDSNTDLKRAREDLNKALKDQEEDYLKSVKRSQEDLAQVPQGQQRRLHQGDDAAARDDLKRNLRNAQDDLRTTLGDMAEDRDTAMDRAETALDIQLTRMAEDIKEADMVIAGDMETLAEETNRAIHGKTVHWTKLMKNDTQLWLTGWKQDVIPQVKAAYAGDGHHRRPTWPPCQGAGQRRRRPPGTPTAPTGPPATAAAAGTPRAARSRAGPRTPRPTTSTSRPTAGEFVQPVKAVNYYGAGVHGGGAHPALPQGDRRSSLAEGGMVYKQMETWLHKNLPGRGDHQLLPAGRDHGAGQRLDARPGQGAGHGPEHDHLQQDPGHLRQEDPPALLLPGRRAHHPARASRGRWTASPRATTGTTCTGRCSR